MMDMLPLIACNNCRRQSPWPRQACPSTSCSSPCTRSACLGRRAQCPHRSRFPSCTRPPPAPHRLACPAPSCTPAYTTTVLHQQALMHMPASRTSQVGLSSTLLYTCMHGSNCASASPNTLVPPEPISFECFHTHLKYASHICAATSATLELACHVA